MKKSGLSEWLEDLVENKVKEMITADEEFAKRIRRLIDYTYGEVKEGEYEEIDNG